MIRHSELKFGLLPVIADRADFVVAAEYDGQFRIQWAERTTMPGSLLRSDNSAYNGLNTPRCLGHYCEVTIPHTMG